MGHYMGHYMGHLSHLLLGSMFGHCVSRGVLGLWVLLSLGVGSFSDDQGNRSPKEIPSRSLPGPPQGERGIRSQNMRSGIS